MTCTRRGSIRQPSCSISAASALESGETRVPPLSTIPYADSTGDACSSSITRCGESCRDITALKSCGCSCLKMSSHFWSLTIDVASCTKPGCAGHALKSWSLKARVSIARTLCLGTRWIETLMCTSPASWSAVPMCAFHSRVSPALVPTSEKKPMPIRTSLSLGWRLWW